MGQILTTWVPPWRLTRNYPQVTKSLEKTKLDFF